MDANAGVLGDRDGAVAVTRESDSADCSAEGSARAADVTCTITNDDQPVTLHVIKHVVNDNGGDATAAEFTMNVDGTNVAPSAVRGRGVAGDSGDVERERGVLGDRDGPVGLQRSRTRRIVRRRARPGSDVTCTITNNDQPVTLHVIKHVINNNGGDTTASQFTMNVDGTNVAPSGPFAGAESPGTAVTLDANAAFSVTETGPERLQRSRTRPIAPARRVRDRQPM